MGLNEQVRREPALSQRKGSKTTDRKEEAQVGKCVARAGMMGARAPNPLDWSRRDEGRFPKGVVLRSGPGGEEEDCLIRLFF